MASFAVLALALAAVALGAVLVAAVQVRRGWQRLRATFRSASAKLRPLLDELTTESAVTSTEVEALRATIATHRDARGATRPY